VVGNGFKIRILLGTVVIATSGALPTLVFMAAMPGGNLLIATTFSAITGGTTVGRRRLTFHTLNGRTLAPVTDPRHGPEVKHVICDGTVLDGALPRRATFCHKLQMLVSSFSSYSPRHRLVMHVICTNRDAPDPHTLVHDQWGAVRDGAIYRAVPDGELAALQVHPWAPSHFGRPHELSA
jgi:hypothetical protein